MTNAPLDKSAASRAGDSDRRAGVCSLDSPALQPLRTHNHYVERWLPPDSPFVTYEPQDETWARYCGIGRVERRLDDLFDVRDQLGDLVGYTRWNPAEQYRRSLHVEIPVLEDRRLPLLDVPADVQRTEIRTVRIQISTWGFEDDRFLCWRLHLKDAEVLVRSKWIECIGEDGIEEYCYTLRERAMRRLYEGRLRP